MEDVMFLVFNSGGSMYEATCPIYSAITTRDEAEKIGQFVEEVDGYYYQIRTIAEKKSYDLILKEVQAELEDRHVCPADEGECSVILNYKTKAHGYPVQISEVFVKNMEDAEKVVEEINKLHPDFTTEIIEDIQSRGSLTDIATSVEYLSDGAKSLDDPKNYRYSWKNDENL
jgi:hypothetical protein